MEKTIENVLEAFKGYIVSSPFIMKEITGGTTIGEDTGVSGAL